MPTLPLGHPVSHRRCIRYDSLHRRPETVYPRSEQCFTGLSRADALKLNAIYESHVLGILANMDLSFYPQSRARP